MSLIFKVGEHQDMLPVPRNFPSCGNWQPKIEKITATDLSDTSNNVTTHTPKDTASVLADETVENDVRQLVKLLPQVLRMLQTSSSSRISIVSYFFFYFSAIIAII